MSSPVETWPLAVLTPKHPGFWPFGGVRRGPDSLSQLQQFDNLAGGPLWRARYSDIPVYCRARVLAAQAVQGLAMQGVGLFRVWRYPASRSPGAASTGGGGGVTVPGVPFSDGASFSDGTLFAGVSMSASFAGAGELYGSVIEVTSDQASAIQGGMEFSVYDPVARWRMHRINRVLDSAGNVVSLEITPPLRFDVAAGLELDFETPSCTMRMTNAESFLQMLEWNEWADLTAEFEEAFW